MAAVADGAGDRVRHGRAFADAAHPGAVYRRFAPPEPSGGSRSSGGAGDDLPTLQGLIDLAVETAGSDDSTLRRLW